MVMALMTGLGRSSAHCLIVSARLAKRSAYRPPGHIILPDEADRAERIE